VTHSANIAAATSNDASSSTLTPRSYSLAAIWPHWTIAVLIVAQIALGWVMNEAVPDHSPTQKGVGSQRKITPRPQPP
jgi:hypothetical protein